MSEIENKKFLLIFAILIIIGFSFTLEVKALDCGTGEADCLATGDPNCAGAECSDCHSVTLCWDEFDKTDLEDIYPGDSLASIDYDVSGDMGSETGLSGTSTSFSSLNENTSYNWLVVANFITRGGIKDNVTSGPYSFQTPICSYNLYVSKDPPGGGGVSSTDGGIDCGPDCSETYLSGTSATLNVNPASGYGFVAWSGDCSGTGNTCTLTMDSDKNVTSTFTQSPYIESGSQQIDYEDYCGDFMGEGKIGFSWKYRDDDNDNQSRFDFRVNDVNDVNDPNPEVSSTYSGLNNPDGTTNNQVVLVVPSPGLNEITYGQTYYWWARVWDVLGNNSGWVKGPDFTTESHAWPWPDFTYSPSKPSVDEEIEFTNNSTCYDLSNNPISCSELKWDFDSSDGIDFNNPDAVGESVTTTYSNTGLYIVTLRAIDSDGNYCDGSLSIEIGLPLPEWKEILPIIWLKNLFATIIEFFKIRI